MAYLLWFAHTDSSLMARVDIIPNPARKPVPCGPPPPETNSVEVIAKYIRGVNEVANIHPWTFPARSRYIKDVLFPEGDVTGPVPEGLMSLKAIGPIAGAEWAVPVPRSDAAMAAREREMANCL